MKPKGERFRRIFANPNSKYTQDFLRNRFHISKAKEKVREKKIVKGKILSSSKEFYKFLIISSKNI